MPLYSDLRFVTFLSQHLLHNVSMSQWYCFGFFQCRVDEPLRWAPNSSKFLKLRWTLLCFTLLVESAAAVTPCCLNCEAYLESLWCVKIQLYHKKSEHNLLSVARLFHQGCSVDMFRWICFKKHDSGCIFRMIYIDKPFKYTLPCPDMILLGPRWRAWQLQPGVTIVPPTLATRSGASEAFCMFTLHTLSAFHPSFYCLLFMFPWIYGDR